MTSLMAFLQPLDRSNGSERNSTPSPLPILLPGDPTSHMPFLGGLPISEPSVPVAHWQFRVPGSDTTVGPRPRIPDAKIPSPRPRNVNIVHPLPRTPPPNHPIPIRIIHPMSDSNEDLSFAMEILRSSSHFNEYSLHWKQLKQHCFGFAAPSQW